MATTAVLGPSSTVSAAIVRKLRADGHEVIEAPISGSTPELKATLAGATAVVHAAEPSDTDTVFEVAAGIGAEQVIVLSTAAVYGAWENNPVPLTENAVLRPNPGIEAVFARAEIERLAHEWVADHPGATLTILRPCTVVATGAANWPTPDMDGVAGLGSGEGSRQVQFLHIDDLAGAVSVALANKVSGIRNVAPAGWITEDEARALSGGRVVALPEPVRRLARRAKLGKTPTRGVEALSSHSWVVASDALRADGWEPVYDNREALVATRQPTWWQRLSPTKRQELSMAVIGGAAVIAIVAAALGIRARKRRK